MYFASSNTVCFPLVCYQFQQMCIQPSAVMDRVERQMAYTDISRFTPRLYSWKMMRKLNT